MGLWFLGVIYKTLESPKCSKNVSVDIYHLTFVLIAVVENFSVILIYVIIVILSMVCNISICKEH